MSNRLISVLCLPFGEKAVYTYALLGVGGILLLLTRSHHQTRWLTIAGEILVVPFLIWLTVAVLIVVPAMLATRFQGRKAQEKPTRETEPTT